MFKDILVDIMQKRGVTSYRLTKDTGISNGLISSWVNGNKTPSSGNLKKLADYFEVSTDFLLGVSDDPTPKEIPPDDPAVVEGRRLLRKMGVQREDGSIDYEKLAKLDEFITLNKHLVLGKGDNGK